MSPCGTQHVPNKNNNNKTDGAGCVVVGVRDSDRDNQMSEHSHKSDRVRESLIKSLRVYTDGRTHKNMRSNTH